MNKKSQVYNKLLEVKEKIISRYSAGESCVTIAKDYNCHGASVWNFLCKQGVSIRPAGGFHKAKKESFKNGYKIIPAPMGYPKKYGNGGLLYYEHILKIEKRLGRYLAQDECGHHIDLDKLNNEDSNLIHCGTKEHMAIHNQLDQLVSKLIKANIIKFNDTERKYYY